MFPLIPATQKKALHETPVRHSLEFGKGNSSYLERIVTQEGSHTTATLAVWVKQLYYDYSNIFSATPANAASRANVIQFVPPGHIRFYTGLNIRLQTSAVYRDFFDWQHLVFVFDTTNEYPTERLRLFINGKRVRDFIHEQYPARGYSFNAINHINRPHYFGNFYYGGTYRNFTGLLADAYWIDGLALDADAFGQWHGNVWIPKRYTGEFGINGGHYEFSNAADIGYDSSGNNNSLTPVNITSTQQSNDTPFSPGYNLITLAKVFPNSTHPQGTITLPRISTGGIVTATNYIIPQDGNLYAFEARPASINYLPHPILGFGVPERPRYYARPSYETVGTGVSLNAINQIRHFDATVTTVQDQDTWRVGQVRQAYARWDNGLWKIWFRFANGEYAGGGDPATDSLPSTSFAHPTALIAFCASYSSVLELCFDYTQFTLAPAPNAVQMKDKKPPAIVPQTAMQLLNWQGRGVQHSIPVGFSPDFACLVPFSEAAPHWIGDTVRQKHFFLQTDSDQPQQDQEQLFSFADKALHIGTDERVNKAGEQYGALCLKRGARYGFDMVSFAIAPSGLQRIPHNLGGTPEVIFVKDYRVAGKWLVYWQGLTSVNQTLHLNTSQAPVTVPGLWGAGPAPDSFEIMANYETSTGSSAIAYLFRSVPGFFKAGVYTGNGCANGPFVFCDFLPEAVLLKSPYNNMPFSLFCQSRNPYNPAQKQVPLNALQAEHVRSYECYDLLSRGFKVRGTACNVSGASHGYMAWARQSYPYTNAR